MCVQLIELDCALVNWNTSCIVILIYLESEMIVCGPFIESLYFRLKNVADSVYTRLGTHSYWILALLSIPIP